MYLSLESFCLIASVVCTLRYAHWVIALLRDSNRFVGGYKLIRKTAAGSGARYVGRVPRPLLLVTPFASCTLPRT